MNKKIKVKVLLMVFICVAALNFSYPVFAGTIATSITTSNELWGIGEYDEGGSVIIPCAAKCNVRVTEDYDRPSPGFVAVNSSTIFAYAENWGGEAGGYDLTVTAGSKVSFDTYGSHSLSNYNNVIVDPDWIWSCTSSTSSTGFMNYGMTATGSGSFNAPDAVIWLPIYWKPSARTFSAVTAF